jgi:hypothetical protein
MTTKYSSNWGFVQFYLFIVLLFFVSRASYQLPLIRRISPVNSPNLS